MKQASLFRNLLLLLATLVCSCTCQYSYFATNAFSQIQRGNNNSSIYVNVIPNGITNELSYYKPLVAVPYDKTDPVIVRSKGSQVCFVGTTDTIYSNRVGDSERYTSELFKKYIRQKRDLILITGSEIDSLGFRRTVQETFSLRRTKGCSIRIVH